MLIKIFSLTFNSATGDFDDGPLREFLKDKEVISMSDHFFTRNEIPYISVVVKYYPYRKEASPQSSSGPTKGSNANPRQREPAAEPLAPENEQVYNMLRDWRSGLSRLNV